MEDTRQCRLYVFQFCGVCSSREGADKSEVIWERGGRFITGNPGEQREANIAQMWCRCCAEVVLRFLRLLRLFVLAARSDSDTTALCCITASLSLPHFSFQRSHIQPFHAVAAADVLNKESLHYYC